MISAMMRAVRRFTQRIRLMNDRSDHDLRMMTSIMQKIHEMSGVRETFRTDKKKPSDAKT